MKSIVITGSTRGIGQGLARAFLELGCRVAVNGRSSAKVDEVVAALGAEFGQERVAGSAGDITEVADMERLWQVASEAFGGVDVWINNAAMSLKRKQIWEQDPADLKKIVDANVYGLMATCGVVVRGMIAQGRGALWNMEGLGSGGEHQSMLAIYGATKRALRHFTQGLARDVKGTGVQVNLLSPGIVATDLLVGDYDGDLEGWKKSKKIFNILGDRVETVCPWMARKVLETEKNGARVAWLTTPKAALRFMTAFRKRDIFDGMEPSADIANERGSARPAAPLQAQLRS